MAIMQSLHIGLDFVDSSQYNGWDGQLSSAVKDARDMRDFATSIGFNSSLIVNSDASCVAVVDAISRMATGSAAGDFYFITFSGHGGQIEDTGGDEAFDQTWVLYEMQLIDDVLGRLWSRFAPGARVVVQSDSCHSGTVTRAAAMSYRSTIEKNSSNFVTGDDQHDESPSPKSIPLDTAELDIKRRRDDYQLLRQISSGSRNDDFQAAVLLLAACADNQQAFEGANNGRFTEKFLEVWDYGAFRGNYVELIRRISQGMPPDQTPQLYFIGSSARDFRLQPAFVPSADSGQVGGSSTTVAEGEGTIPTSDARPVIRQGDSGSHVEELQSLLVVDGYLLDVDGFFGAATAAAVRSFQLEAGLTADGIVGTQTWVALLRK